MNHDYEVETIPVTIRHVDLRTDDEPNLLVPATLATCSRCHAIGCALGQFRRNVDEAMDEMRNCCYDDGPREYVLAPGTKLPGDGDPFEKEDDHDTKEPDRDR